MLGEAVVFLFGLPIPGAIAGMALLFGWLTWRGSVPTDLKNTSSGLLSHLALLFVAPGAGIVLYLVKIASEGWTIAFVLLSSSVVVFAVTAGVVALGWRLGASGILKNKGDHGESNGSHADAGTSDGAEHAIVFGFNFGRLLGRKTTL